MITTDTEISYTIDWYSLTVDNPMYHPKLTMRCRELERGKMGYSVGVQFADGREELTNPDRPDMRTHIIMSGSALTAIEAEQLVRKIDVVRWCMPGQKVSRIDVAVDVRHGSLDIGLLARYLKSGKAETKAKQYYLTKTLSGQGETLYIGSPKSRKRLRIYDKAAEQGVSGDWTRIEAQIRSPHADGLRNLLVSGEDGLSHIPAYINGLASWEEYRDWGLVMGGAKEEPRAEKRPDTDTRRWLLTTVAKALAKEVDRSPDGEALMDVFLRVVHEERVEQAKSWFEKKV